jgi:FAD/FMN-containing dehydrogenase
MELPEGVSASDLAAAVAEFQSVVGKEWVFTAQEDLDLYRDPYSLLWDEEAERTVSAAVAPDNAGEVVAIVKIANQYRIPLYPISTGKNLGYGGPAPALSGSVVLDLKRMNRIVEINETNGYVVVEPGVSYYDLYDYIQEKGLKLWIDCAGPGWGSLIGNALDGGLGYTLAPYRSHFDAHCGIEAVLPTGKLVRTGMGALPGSKTWQQFKPGFGPRIDGLFKQSNFGVVTKMGFWLMPAPESIATGVVTVPQFKDLVPMVDIISRLENAKIVQGLWSLASPVTGTAVDGGPGGGASTQKDPRILEILGDPAGVDMDRLDAVGREIGLPFWSISLTFYGPRKLIEAQWECVTDAMRAVKGCTFKLEAIRSLPLSAEELARERDTVTLGVPTLRTFDLGPMTNFEGEPVVGHVFFSPILPRSGEAALEASKVFAAMARDFKLPYPPLQFPGTFFERAFVYVVALPVTRSPTVNAKVRDMFRQLVVAAAERGWGEYRTTPAFYDMIMDVYSFNDHALRGLLESIKDALDPNGILSAGRYAIWPKHLRKT